MMKPLYILFAACVLLSCSESALTPVNYNVSNEAVEKWATELENGMYDRRPEAFSEALDLNGMTDRIFNMSSLGLSTYMSNAINIEGMKKGIRANMSEIGNEVILSSDSIVGYQMVRIREIEGVKRCLFRMYGSEGLNYHDFEMVEVNGKTKALDLNVMYTGENLSKTLRDFFLSSGALGSDKEVNEALDKINATNDVRSLLQNGDIAEARAAYDALDEAMKKSKAVASLDIEIAALEGDSIYGAKLQAYNEKFPNVVGAELMALDVHWVNGEFTEAMRCLDRMDSKLGGDPFLDYYRASVSIDLENYAESIKYLDKLKKAGYAKFADYYFVEALAHIGLKDYDSVIKSFNALTSNFNITSWDLMMHDFGSDFMESSEFNTWKEAQI
jgi:hypothetical protein